MDSRERDADGMQQRAFGITDVIYLSLLIRFGNNSRSAFGGLSHEFADLPLQIRSSS